MIVFSSQFDAAGTKSITDGFVIVIAVKLNGGLKKHNPKRKKKNKLYAPVTNIAALQKQLPE